jgi:hypothetical protein
LTSSGSDSVNVVGGAGFDPVLRMVMGSLLGGPPVDMAKVPGTVGVRVGPLPGAAVVPLGGATPLGLTPEGAVETGGAVPAEETDEVVCPIGAVVVLWVLDAGGWATAVGLIVGSGALAPDTMATVSATVTAAAPSKGGTKLVLPAAIVTAALALPAAK